ncbi:ABC transporter permease [[Mycoplasma] gypis]|uniref:ABC transporter permease subunit n=1 Tax=[Mycoplasma] gypis TaxID=92404 RepID=A0ABZ2RV52_9BACT|nr:ABC transporter permease subunit [[Mycoplasma] gypis]MBN0919124.1 ABC transporter permease subunit [[Mycoplasma] gypis]
MNRLWSFIKKSYIGIIIILFYIPIIFGTIYSFNAPSDKGVFSVTTWNKFTYKAYAELFSQNQFSAFINSFLIGVCASLLVIAISLITVYGLWKQKQKRTRQFVQGSVNIPMINSEIITALTLTIVLTTFFGVLKATNEGFVRVIISHTVVILPYGIMIMLPKSDKFSKNIFEASQDLGYSKIRTWFKTYFIYMLGSIGFVFVVSMVLSFDDFIVTRIVSNTETLGTKLYEGQFQAWSLALGAICLLIVIVANIVYILTQVKVSTLLNLKCLKPLKNRFQEQKNKQKKEKM